MYDKPPVLSVLMCGVPERFPLLAALYDKINQQVAAVGPEKVEVVALIDNKHRSLGAKRQALFELARGEYFGFVDDDDNVSWSYICEVLISIDRTHPDVICYPVDCTINGAYGQTDVSIKHAADEEWSPRAGIKRRPGTAHVWRRQMCVDAGCKFADLPGREHDQFFHAALAAAKTEHLIGMPLYSYRHSRTTTAAVQPT